MPQKFGGNLANITAGDLLNKSQEELVLILIQLRRQAAGLGEAIDACKAEQDNCRNAGERVAGELRQHTAQLEEQLSRVNPVVGLVDNMVKLGTLYRGEDNWTLQVSGAAFLCAPHFTPHYAGQSRRWPAGRDNAAARVIRQATKTTGN